MIQFLFYSSSIRGCSIIRSKYCILLFDALCVEVNFSPQKTEKLPLKNKKKRGFLIFSSPPFFFFLLPSPISLICEGKNLA